MGRPSSSLRQIQGVGSSNRAVIGPLFQRHRVDDQLGSVPPLRLIWSPFSPESRHLSRTDRGRLPRKCKADLESFEDSRYAFHSFHNSVSGRTHQGNAEVAFPAFAKADAGGYHHSFPVHQQFGQLRG